MLEDLYSVVVRDGSVENLVVDRQDLVVLSQTPITANRTMKLLSKTVKNKAKNAIGTVCLLRGQTRTMLRQLMRSKSLLIRGV